MAMIGVEGGIFGEIATTAEIIERLADDTDQSVAGER
jgi:hypothetical protein